MAKARMSREDRAARKKYEKWLDEQSKEKARIHNEAILAAEADGVVLFPGEIRPNEDAATVTDARIVVDRWIKALGLASIEGESLMDSERRIFEEWWRRSGPLMDARTYLLTRETIGLSGDCPPFESKWRPILEPTEV
jgi:hypothetical protein